MKRYLTLLIIFAVIEISLALYLTLWREHFWNAVAAKQSVAFISQLAIFLGVALVCCFVSGISGYLINLSTIKWRDKLNHQAIISEELGRPFPEFQVDNITQRIQQDCKDYPELVLGLGYGFTKALFYILVFSISLVISFEWWYLCVLLAYTILGSVCTSYIAKPLINLNYNQQQAEASYRNDLSVSNFQNCLSLMLGIAKRTKRLTYFQQFYMQIAVVIPLLIIAPTYFSSAMTVGMLMRFNSLGGTILENMGYGISSWGQINMLLSCRKRLKEINVI